MNKKHISVTSIVLTWNSVEFIESCLKSLQKSKFKTNIMVVDNDSHDHTRELITKKFPDISLVNSGDNLGYAGGNNFGIKIALKNKPDYIFIFNPDANIDENCIGLLVERMSEDKKIAVISPMIYYNQSSRIWYAGSNINWKNGATPHNGANELDIGQFDTVLQTGRANGCAMLIRSSAIKKTGLMDENYFLYYEETDWSVRFKRAGYTIGFEPLAKVWHEASSSTGGHRSSLYQYYMTRNRLYFLKKFSQQGKLQFFMKDFAQNCFDLLVIMKKYGPRVFFNLLAARVKGYYDYSKSRLGKQTI